MNTIDPMKTVATFQSRHFVASCGVYGDLVASLHYVYILLASLATGISSDSKMHGRRACFLCEAYKALQRSGMPRSHRLVFAASPSARTSIWRVWWPIHGRRGKVLFHCGQIEPHAVK